MGNVQTAKELLTWLEKVDPEMLLFTGGLFGIEDFTISNGEDYEGYEVWDTLEISDEEFDRYELLRIELYDLVQEIIARARGEN